METLRVKVKYLQAGDYLIDKKCTVVSVGYSPFAGSKSVVLRRNDATDTHIATWRSNTNVVVQRHTVGADLQQESAATQRA